MGSTRCLRCGIVNIHRCPRWHQNLTHVTELAADVAEQLVALQAAKRYQLSDRRTDSGVGGGQRSDQSTTLQSAISMRSLPFLPPARASSSSANSAFAGDHL